MSAPNFDDLVLIKPAGYKEVTPFPGHAVRHSYVSGNKKTNAIRVRYFLHESTKELAARCWFGPETEGPPQHAHGGSQAALLDEGMGAAAWLSGYPVLAAKIEVHFRKSLPLHTTLTMTARVDKVEGRKVYAIARLEADEGYVYSESTGLFVQIDPAEFKKRAE